MVIKKIRLYTQYEQVISYAGCIFLIMICGIMFLFHDYSISFLFQTPDGQTEVNTGPVRINYTIAYSENNSQPAKLADNQKRVNLHWVKKVLRFIRIDFDRAERSYYDLTGMRINNTDFAASEMMQMVHKRQLIRPELIDGRILRLHLEKPEKSDYSVSNTDHYLSFECQAPVRYIDYNSRLFYLKLICFLGLAALIIFLTGTKIILMFVRLVSQIFPELLLVSITILFFSLRPLVNSFFLNEDALLVTLLKSDINVFYIYIFSFLLCGIFSKWYTAVMSSIAVLVIQIIYLLDCFAVKRFNTRFDISDLPHWTEDVNKGGFFILHAITQSYFAICLLIVTLSMILTGILVRRAAGRKSNKVFIIVCSSVIVFLAGFQLYPAVRHFKESLYWNPFSYSYNQTMNKKYSKAYRSRVTPFRLHYRARKGLGLRRNVILLCVESLSSYQSKLFSDLSYDYLPQFDEIVKKEASAYSKNYLSAAFNTATSTFAILTGFSPISPNYYAIFENSKFYHNPLPQVFKKAGYVTVCMTLCNIIDHLDRLIFRMDWSRIITNKDPVFNNCPRYIFDSVSDDKLFDAIISQVKDLSSSGSGEKPASPNFFIFAQTIGIHTPFYDFRSKKYSYQETVKTFDLLFADFMKRLHAAGFFRQGGILIVTGDHRVMLPISQEEEKVMGFFTPQCVPLVIFGNQPCKIDTDNLYSHVDLHYSLQWLMLDQVERHQYQRNFFINDIDKNDRKQFFCSFYQLHSNLSDMLFNTWDHYGRIHLSGDDTTIEGKNLSPEEKSKIESFILWTREHMHQSD